MGLFSSETYRSFAIGFGVGAVALFAVLTMQGEASFSPKLIGTAEAAPALLDNTLAQPAQ